MGHRGIYRMSLEDLARELRLPEGTNILDVIKNFKDDTVEIKVEHPDLPMKHRGDHIHWVNPKFTR